MMNKNGHLAYQELIPRLHEVVCSTLPPEATVVVASKGDNELLKLDGRRAWHFPQREDGVYAGYYPADSAAAITHLETLRARGADYLLFPSTAFWWLEHYQAFGQHLKSHYRVVVRQEDTCLIFALREAENGQQLPAIQSQQLTYQQLIRQFEEPERSLREYVDESLIDDLRTLFDVEYYTKQAGSAFSSADAALIDYLERGSRQGYDPHILFDTTYYLNRYPQARWAGVNPLIHFLSHAVSEGQDPHPYFDTEYYYSQAPRLRENRLNALVHYLTHEAHENAAWPNPLFRNRYYLNAYKDVKESGLNPLVHYLKFGCEERRFISHVHKDIAGHLIRTSRKSLLRGKWKNGRVLLFSHGDSGAREPVMLKVAKVLAAEYHLNSLVVLLKRQELVAESENHANVMILDDFQLACDILRPSALRMLVKTLCSTNPLLAICEIPELLETLKANGVPTFYLCPDFVDRYPKKALERVFHYADRVIFTSSTDFHSVAKKIGFYPPNVALCPQGLPDPALPDTSRERARREPGATVNPGREYSAEEYAGYLLDLARRDFHLPKGTYHVKQNGTAKATRKIVIPCADWGISGVNSALEAIGKELIHLGWDVEILFTRDQSEIIESAGDEAHMPQVPYRYLQPDNPGIAGTWEGLISYLEMNAPCIMFMTYDFTANAVAPALTNRVGAVAWVQADDGDYYEQAYRLGRYCNAIVCVSERTKQRVAELNPVIGNKARVIHNSSVRESEIVRKRSVPTEKMKLIYTGRLVQHQKRILDFIQLAQSLDRTGVDYQLTLVGEFSARENAREIFENTTRAHLEDGRINLPGRMVREQILEEFNNHDIFILLSDFEGLPLSLLEAMTQGCVPAVAEMESGIPEVLTNGKNGLIVGGRNYDEWAALLVGLWRNPRKFSQMSLKARKTVREHFTVEEVGRQFDDLFRSVAAELCSGAYTRPPCLNWGEERSPAGDVLLPLNMYRIPTHIPQRKPR